MSFDLQRILESKRAFRQRLAARPVVEKLRMLDALRERAISIRGAAARPVPEQNILREDALPDPKRPL
jgi:hypothetical protein